jgi:hypothetical protein
MKKILSVITIILCVSMLVLVLPGCSLRVVVGNGQVVTKDIALTKEVTGLVNNGSFAAVIDPSIQGKAVLEGESNILELLDVKQDNAGVVEISTKSGVNLSLGKPVTVKVPAVRGGSIQLNGSGSITYAGTEPLKGNDFRLTNNGSGSMSLLIGAETAEAVLAGSGSVTLTGSTAKVEANLSGSGQINARDLAAVDAKVQISGSGKVSVNVRGEFNATITGSGDAVYYGNPAKVVTNDSGSGEAIKGE